MEILQGGKRGGQAQRCLSCLPVPYANAMHGEGRRAIVVEEKRARTRDGRCVMSQVLLLRVYCIRDLEWPTHGSTAAVGLKNGKRNHPLKAASHRRKGLAKVYLSAGHHSCSLHAATRPWPFFFPVFRLPLFLRCCLSRFGCACKAHVHAVGRHSHTSEEEAASRRNRERHKGGGRPKAERGKKRGRQPSPTKHMIVLGPSP